MYMSESIFKKAAKRFKSIFTKGTKVYVRDKDTEREEMESAEKELRRLASPSSPLASDYGYGPSPRTYPTQIAALKKQKQSILNLLTKVSPDARRSLERSANFQIKHIDNAIEEFQGDVDRREAKMAEDRRKKAEKEAAKKDRPIMYQGYSFEEYKRHYR